MCDVRDGNTILERQGVQIQATDEKKEGEKTLETEGVTQFDSTFIQTLHRDPRMVLTFMSGLHPSPTFSFPSL